jgi:hypothetical protein
VANGDLCFGRAADATDFDAGSQRKLLSNAIYNRAMSSENNRHTFFSESSENFTILFADDETISMYCLSATRVLEIANTSAESKEATNWGGAHCAMLNIVS